MPAESKTHKIRSVYLRKDLTAVGRKLAVSHGLSFGKFVDRALDQQALISQLGTAGGDEVWLAKKKLTDPEIALMLTGMTHLLPLISFNLNLMKIFKAQQESYLAGATPDLAAELSRNIDNAQVTIDIMYANHRYFVDELRRTSEKFQRDVRWLLTEMGVEHLLENLDDGDPSTNAKGTMRQHLPKLERMAKGRARKLLRDRPTK